MNEEQHQKLLKEAARLRRLSQRSEPPPCLPGDLKAEAERLRARQDEDMSDGHERL